MNKYFISVFIILIFAGCSKDSEKKGTFIYKSAFGFSSEISDNWVVVSRDEMNKKGLDLRSRRFEIFDEKYLKGVELRTMTGRVELILNMKKRSDFNDNININLSFGNLLKKSQEKEFCEKMPAAFRKLLNKDITFFKCGLRKIGATDFLHLSYEGVIDKTRSSQYQFQVAPGRIVIATLTCSEGNYEELNREFDNFIKSIVIEI